MKKRLFVLFFLSTCLISVLYGQQKQSGHSYDRVALTIVYVDDPYPDEKMNDRYRQSARNFYSTANIIPDRYDDHAIPAKIIRFDLNNLLYVNPDSLKLMNEISQNRISGQMVERWFGRKEDGTFSMDLIKDRGRYNASDNDYLISTASERQKSALEDLGEKLLQKSYLLLVNHCDIEQLKDSNNKPYYRGAARAYLYQLVWDEETGAIFYNNLWINEQDDAAVRKQKIDQFNAMPFKVRFVRSFKVESNQLLTFGLDQMSDDEKLNLLNSQLGKAVVEKLVGANSDFIIKKTLISSKPIAATIGSKEGLFVDQRFFVYETVMNRNEQLVNKRRSVIRVKNVSDNKRETAGKTTPSEFYQVASGKIDHYGMFIQEKKEYGVGLSASKVFKDSYGEGIGGLELMATLRISRFIKSPGWFIYGDLGFDKTHYNYSYYGYVLDYHNFTRFSVGLMKEYHFMKIFQAGWRAGYGIESTELTGNSEKANQIGLSSSLILAGGKLGLNLHHNIQLVAGLNWYIPFGKASLEVGEQDAVDADEGWTYFFEDRKGISSFIGLNFSF